MERMAKLTDISQSYPTTKALLLSLALGDAAGNHFLALGPVSRWPLLLKGRHVCLLHDGSEFWGSRGLSIFTVQPVLSKLSPP